MRFRYLALLTAAITPALASAQQLNDAVIVGIFDAANGWDVATGSLASKHSMRADVKEFGDMLATVHKSVQNSGRDLAKKLGVTPTPVARDFALAVQHQAAMKKLSSLNGPAFDKAFLEHEVAFHAAVIDAVTKQFLPAIQNAELKKFVQDLAPAFVAHKAKAEELLRK
jgi:putative membrane protein